MEQQSTHSITTQTICYYKFVAIHTLPVFKELWNKGYTRTQLRVCELLNNSLSRFIADGLKLFKEISEFKTSSFVSSRVICSVGRVRLSE